MRLYSGRVVLAAFLCLFIGFVAEAELPSNPVTDPQFHLLPDGSSVFDISVNGSRLRWQKGAGSLFTQEHWERYLRLKQESQVNFEHKVQWVLMNLDTHQVVAESADSGRKVFGASTSKVFVAGSLLDWNHGRFLRDQKQLAANMLVVSSNSAWTELQRQLGEGRADLGRERNFQFTQRMGYQRTRGFQGYWGSIHGNELTASELCEFMYDTYMNHYEGAEYLWKFLYTSRTGSGRGKKYLPQNLIVGGKTGTYDGPTENPETGRTTNPDGTPYTVRVRNHLMVFHHHGHQYALAILANTGSDESAALLAGGLFREYIE